MPDSLQQMIERQIERLNAEDQRRLEVASVAGMEFSAAAVAAGTETETEIVEERCAELARHARFLRTSGTADWPDSTVAARYSFLHALYQEVLYNRISTGRRQRLHQRIGEREEQAYGERAREIAAELAVHFERGGDYRRAVHYRHQAGENAVRRSAYVEAVAHLTRGLEVLKTLPDTPERTQQELVLQVPLGAALMTTKGFGAPEGGKAYTRARELCRLVGETPQLLPVLFGLWRFYNIRAEFQTARELAEQCLSLAQSLQEPRTLVVAHHVLECTLYWLGEFVPARAHQEQGVVLYNSQPHNLYSPSWGDSGVHCLSYAAFALLALGYPDQALKRVQEAYTLAQQLSHPFSLNWTTRHWDTLRCDPSGVSF